MIHGDFDIAPGETRSRDAQMDLREIISHAREGEQLASRSAADARQKGDESLASFFEELTADHQRWERRALEHLETCRKQSANSKRDLVLEQSMESFPASDPPGSY